MAFDLKRLLPWLAARVAALALCAAGIPAESKLQPNGVAIFLIDGIPMTADQLLAILESECEHPNTDPAIRRPGRPA